MLWDGHPHISVWLKDDISHSKQWKILKWSNIGHSNFFIASPFLTLMSSTQPERFLFPAKPQVLWATFSPQRPLRNFVWDPSRRPKGAKPSTGEIPKKNPHLPVWWLSLIITIYTADIIRLEDILQTAVEDILQYINHMNPCDLQTI